MKLLLYSLYPFASTDVSRQGVRALDIPPCNFPVSGCVTVSLGVPSIIPRPEELPSLLIAAADTALYQVKSSGRDARRDRIATIALSSILP